jgi:hypothetical protein
VVFSYLWATVLAFALISKLSHYEELHDVLWKSNLVPYQLVPYVSVMVVLFELILMILLLNPSGRLLALKVSLWTTSFFTAYSLWRLQAGIAAPCGCFTGLFTLPPAASAAADAALLAGCAWAIRSYRTIPAPDSVVLREIPC